MKCEYHFSFSFWLIKIAYLNVTNNLIERVQTVTERESGREMDRENFHRTTNSMDKLKVSLRFQYAIDDALIRSALIRKKNPVHSVAFFRFISFFKYFRSQWKWTMEKKPLTKSEMVFSFHWNSNESIFHACVFLPLPLITTCDQLLLFFSSFCHWYACISMRCACFVFSFRRILVFALFAVETM